jgi:hypothetical protein
MPEVAPQGQAKQQYAPIIAGVGAALVAYVSAPSRNAL